MEKCEMDFNRKNLKSLISSFNRGVTKQPKGLERKSKVLTPDLDSSDICLPPLLVEAFKSGLGDGLNDCNCDCKENDCSQHASGSHQGCGGCHHHD